NVSYLERVNYSYALNASIVLAKDHREAFSMVENGKVVAFAMDDVLLAGLRASSAKPNDYEIVGEPQSVEPYAIMYRKDDVEFGRLINRTIVAMFQSGEFQTLYKKWFESPIPPNNLNLQLPMNQLMRYNIRWPSDKVD
ncbi:MAG: transporter substrate-binding domain-containing protein, partial [Burkholderiales bacterium]